MNGLIWLAENEPPGMTATLIIPLVIMFGVMYIFMIRPQKRRQLERDTMLKSLKKNDHVMTNGGIFGIVDRVSDSEVMLKVDESKGVKIRVARSAIGNVIKVSGGGRPDKDTEETKK